MEKDVVIVDAEHPDLFELPHMLDKLLHFVTGEWQPDLSQQEQLVTHLMTCSYCRVALIALLAGEQEYEKELNSSSETALHDLLMQFVAIHHKLDTLTYECIGSYAETFVTAGRMLADRRFPILAEHMKSCSPCQMIFKDMLAFLNESEMFC